MDHERAIHLHCVRNDGRRETTKLTGHTLPAAREAAKRVLEEGGRFYAQVDICTEDGHIETIDKNTAVVAPAGTPEVLLVEDNAGDALLIGQALEECQIPVHLHIARDGEQALQILAESDFKPDLIILDLNIPRVSGHMVLSRYRPKKTPVVVFTASENKADVDRAFSLGANEYVNKPMDLDDYKSTVCGMVQKWAPSGARGLTPRPRTVVQ
jgi:chemotaxis family two-component system response regulator Rcp1